MALLNDTDFLLPAGRIALGLAYHGSGRRGWQTQADGGGLQDALEGALARFLAAGAPATVCAGRTDAGVHALQQVVHFDTSAVRSTQSWVRGLNAMLPAELRVLWARAVAPDFHARFAARARTYFYILQSAPVRLPHLVGRVGWVHYALDAAAMRSGAQLLCGTHDFSAFRSAQCQAKSPVRSLYAANVHVCGDFLVLELRANAFLHHMVRNLVGALLLVGRGKRAPGWLAEVLGSGDRSQGAATFMADGLYLGAVDYPDYPALPLLGARAALARQLGWVLGDSTEGKSAAYPIK